MGVEEIYAPHMLRIWSDWRDTIELIIAADMSSNHIANLT